MKFVVVLKRVPKQLFAVPQALFFWGCIGSVVVLIYLHGSKWTGVVTLGYQLGGTLIALIAVVEQRKAMSVESFQEVMYQWVRSFWPQHHTVSADLVGGSSVLSGGVAVMKARPGGDTPMDRQLQMVWNAIDSLEDQLGKMQSGLDKHARDTERNFTTIRANFSEDIKHAEKRLVHALTSGPLWVFFGFWLILLSSGVQVWGAACDALKG